MKTKHALQLDPLSRGPFPGILDFDRESIVGAVILEACDCGAPDNGRNRFYITCSVGELAQRVVVALSKHETK